MVHNPYVKQESSHETGPLKCHRPSFLLVWEPQRDSLQTRGAGQAADSHAAPTGWINTHSKQDHTPQDQLLSLGTQSTKLLTGKALSHTVMTAPSRGSGTQLHILKGHSGDCSWEGTQLWESPCLPQDGGLGKPCLRVLWGTVPAPRVMIFENKNVPCGKKQNVVQQPCGSSSGNGNLGNAVGGREDP